MNHCIHPTVCAAAALILMTFASSSDAQPSSNSRGSYVAFQEEDPDSNVEPESDAAGDYDVFYDRLSSQGHWFNDDDYGYVWQPNVAESGSNWRPYADGHWVWTDHGWFWESNEDFGWATYHYGRWITVAGTGWVWVPGDQWAPAWVSWRQTDDEDYVGWAPLPPEASFNVGFQPWCDSYYDIGPASFAFIRVGNFCRPSYQQYFASPQQGLTLINRTRDVTNVTYNNSGIFNNGPQYQRVSQLVQQRAGQRVPNYRINYAAQMNPNSAFETAVQGNQLNVFAPPQKLKPISTGQPQGVKQLGKWQVERGWQNVPPGNNLNSSGTNSHSKLRPLRLCRPNPSYLANLKFRQSLGRGRNLQADLSKVSRNLTANCNHSLRSPVIMARQDSRSCNNRRSKLRTRRRLGRYRETRGKPAHTGRRGPSSSRNITPCRKHRLSNERFSNERFIPSVPKPLFTSPKLLIRSRLKLNACHKRLIPNSRTHRRLTRNSLTEPLAATIKRRSPNTRNNRSVRLGVCDGGASEYPFFDQLHRGSIRSDF